MSAPATTAYETVIGLEVHVQLLTERKMFCGCSAAYADAPPNTHVCPVCMALPGVLPVMNRKAVEFTVMTALALNCEIPTFSKFDRKNYPYPDLLKGYQISQYDLPLSQNGWIDVEVEGQPPRRIGITRAHLEEDTARLTHRTDPATGEGYSLVDMNRSGVPLMEIVGEPDLRSPAEARAYLIKLRQILRYIGVSKANMEEGNFRCDANISLRPVGASELGPKVEVKNMNSFRAVENALKFEVERQTREFTAGNRIAQETRGWVEGEGVTVSQRSKEQAHDYRYFPEPDLAPVTLTEQDVARIRAMLPELPDARRGRFVDQYGLTPYEANLLTDSRARADYYEAAAAAASGSGDAAHYAKQIANWMLGDMARMLHANDIEISDIKVSPAELYAMISAVTSGKITGSAAKTVFEQMFASGKGAEAVISELGLEAIGGEDEITAIVAGVIERHPRAVADFRSGKQEAVKFLVGQAMRDAKGRANPNTLADRITTILTQS